MRCLVARCVGEKVNCFDRESNTGPQDLQSCALQTELSKLLLHNALLYIRQSSITLPTPYYLPENIYIQTIITQSILFIFSSTFTSESDMTTSLVLYNRIILSTQSNHRHFDICLIFLALR